MNVALLAVDSKYPNLALMKISAYHKSVGDSVEWYNSVRQDCAKVEQISKTKGDEKMIQELTMYQAVCDGCGRVLGNPSVDEKAAYDSAYIVEYAQKIGGKLYCPECYEYDEETGEYKSKKEE